MTHVAIATVRERTSRASRVITLVAVLAPPLALLSAAGLLWGVAISWVDVALFGVFYVLCGLGTTVGFHRLFTHKSFETKRWLRATFAVLGLDDDAGPGHPVGHRPPPPPRALGSGRRPALPPRRPRGRGVGAREGLRRTPTSAGCSASKGMERGDHYGRDLFEDRVVRTVDRMYALWVVLTFGLPFLIGYLAGGLSLALGFQALVWAGAIRVFAYQHATFAVNSVCHMFGRRSYRHATRAATTGSSLRSPSARAGTTTITPSRARPGTASSGASSTSPGGRSAAWSGSASRGT